ncbi:hypothetical protein AB0C10_21935 [Microbispora amethystogenes]|uniref:hypothetical protein n=1 Tax=Microbispora amethystogenes TaxID=1427754 RepID=UPI0033F0FADA
MNDHSTTEVRQVIPLQPVPTNPAVATAQQLQAHLQAAYRLPTRIAFNGGAAIVHVGRELHVWCCGKRIAWPNGKTKYNGFPDCDARPAVLSAEAAGLIANRYHQILHGEGR